MPLHLVGLLEMGLELSRRHEDEAGVIVLVAWLLLLDLDQCTSWGQLRGGRVGGAGRALLFVLAFLGGPASARIGGAR